MFALFLVQMGVALSIWGCIISWYYDDENSFWLCFLLTLFSFFIWGTVEIWTYSF